VDISINNKPIVNHDIKKYITGNLNPKFAIYIALFENIIFFVYLFIHKSNISTLIKYGIMIIFVKVIPLFALQNEKIKLPHDLISFSILFIVYILYLILIKKTLYGIYKTSAKYLINNENKTPFFKFYVL